MPWMYNVYAKDFMAIRSKILPLIWFFDNIAAFFEVERRVIKAGKATDSNWDVGQLNLSAFPVHSVFRWHLYFNCLISRIACPPMEQWNYRLFLLARMIKYHIVYSWIHKFQGVKGRFERSDLSCGISHVTIRNQLKLTSFLTWPGIKKEACLICCHLFKWPSNVCIKQNFFSCAFKMGMSKFQPENFILQLGPNKN